jgi:hypothetical protein
MNDALILDNLTQGSKDVKMIFTKYLYFVQQKIINDGSDTNMNSRLRLGIRNL